MPDLDILLAELTCGDDERAEEAAIAIGLQGRSAGEALTNLLENHDPDVRWWVVRALAEIRGGIVTALLIRSLNDSDQSVRHCAALAMRNRPDSAATSALIPLLSSQDRMLAHLARDALIAIGKDATPALLEVLEGKHQPARLEAVRALALIGDYAAVSDLFKLLGSESAVMEYWANEGLQNMGIGMSFFEPS
jgi:HEAT repeat protein